MRGLALGLSIVAVIGMILALIVGYVNNGEINYLVIGLVAVVLSANLLVIRSKKKGKSVN